MGSRIRISQGAVLKSAHRSMKGLLRDSVRSGHMRPNAHPPLKPEIPTREEERSDRKLLAAETGRDLQ